MKKMVFGLLAITLPMFVSWVTMNLSHCHLVTQFPEEKEHHLYPKIQANIKSASLRITITGDTTWAGTTTIYF
ncbi:hypothetical protein [Prevotella sp. E13-27]|uniref:hypothetical protein n=1 Tax=Prevotella sp. E13-27 TaxID=2938122 RepID=UPI00200B978B|nr:hypothetical protein [Prevotella sp. E13-27]MCK8620876.1 hypothetical protein [Prevotella sp. E13-27]